MPQKSSKFTWRRLLVFSILGIVLYLAVTVFQAAKHAITAEEHLHAMLDATKACQSYVEENNGAWPQKWEDIDPFLPADREWTNVHENIKIDFQADPAVLAQQNWESFTGITVKQPTFHSYDGEIIYLIELLQKHHSVDQNNPIEERE